MECEISTSEGVLQLLRTACKLELMQAAAGGDLQSKENLAGLSHLWGRTDEPAARRRT